MAIPTISNVPEDVHRALRTQAEQHGRSTEAEVREILAVAFKPENRVLVGDALAAIGRKSGLTDEDFAILESVRDRTPAGGGGHQSVELTLARMSPTLCERACTRWGP